MPDDKKNQIPVKPVNSIAVRDLSSLSTVQESKAIDEDEFAELYGGNDIIQPLYNPEQLIRLSEQSDILQQCIDAYKTNIAGFGAEMMYDIDYDKADDNKKKELDSMWTQYENFIKYCNFDENFTIIMMKAIEDQERIGWYTIEVIEDAAGHVAGLEHIQAYKVRFCRKEKTPQSVPATILNEYGEPVQITYLKRFRKYVQLVNGAKVFFKEFGDPRILNCKSGEYDDQTPQEDRATSLICSTIYCPYSVYGLPRYMGQLLNIIGNRKAEELNYTYFKDGRHMPMAIVVENGKLTAQSVKALEESKGDLARHKLLVLEGEGLENEISLAEDSLKSSVKVRLEPLAQMLQQDGLFQEYCKNNRDKIRSAFRLHPIYTGESQDYTRATANTARQITEEQVFQPEREEVATKLNNLLKPALGITGVSLKMGSPKISDQTEVARALYPYITSGTATPNMLIDTMGQLLDKSFEPFEGDWADKPLAIVLKEYDMQNALQTQVNSTAVTNSNLKKSDDTAEIVNGLHMLQQTIREAISTNE